VASAENMNRATVCQMQAFYGHSPGIYRTAILSAVAMLIAPVSVMLPVSIANHAYRDAPKKAMRLDERHLINDRLCFE